ncbi:MAG: TonB-dependent receptor [Pyrinomonadaceae bacterium]|nr:TonB-dependent receptor [Pyrinomonadaceae bacterium]
MTTISKLLSICSFLFLFSFSVFAQGGKISGKVTIGSDNSVLHQVSVRISELKLSTVTDDNGHYEFANVPPGRYTIISHQEGFSDLAKTVVLTAGGNEVIDFQLQLSGVREQVTVSATGDEQSTFQSIASVNTVDSNVILERAAVGLGDVLDNQPGVSKRSFGPGNSRPVLRGFDGDRVLVSTDGVRVGSLGSQSGDHGEPVDTLSVERIEVVKGPATLLYGSNAIGGVVNAISGHDEGAHPGLRGYVSGITASNSNQFSGSGGVEYGTKNWMFWGNGSGQRTNDYNAGGNFGKVENSFTRSATGTGGFGYYRDKGFFTTDYNYFQSRYGIPLDFNDPAAELRSLKMHRNNLKFTGGFNDLDSFITGAKFTVDYSKYQHQEIVDNLVGTTFKNNVFSYRGVFDQKKYGDLTGRFGFEGFTRDYSTVGAEVLINGKVRQNSFSVFGLQEIKLNRVTFQFGGRIENNRYNPTDTSLIKRDFTGFSGAAGIRVALWDGGAFVANYTHAYRAPALEELYNNGPHDGTLSFEVGNPNLKAETNNGLDFSIRQQSNRVRAEANFFYYDLKNYVFLAPTGITDANSGLVIARYLQGNSRYMGTELSLDVTANQYLNFLAGLDYVSAELKTGQPLPRISPLRGRVGLDAHYKNLSVRPEFLMVDKQDRVFTNETATAGYGTINLTGTYIIPGKHTANIFSVNAFNLNNKLYFNHISFIKDILPEIGRGVRFSYTVRFF